MYRFLICLLIIATLAWFGTFERQQSINWSKAELAKIASLTLPATPILTQNIVHTGNAVWNNHSAAKLGQQLFFDSRLSGNGTVACASCHQPQASFADPKPFSSGLSLTKRHSPSLIGIATSPWMFWDGRADSLWAQALGPLENPAEHGSNRARLAKLIAKYYSSQYQGIFGKLPNIDQVANDATPLSNNLIWQKNWLQLNAEDQFKINQIFANIGKSLAAYQSLLMPSASRFDRFARQLVTQGHSNLLSVTEQQGLKLFIDDSKSHCIRCHNGPMFTNHDFQVTGIADTQRPIGNDRSTGITQAILSEFNCKGLFSDVKNPEEECLELNYAKRSGDELQYAFKVPSLRNVSQSAPYMHNASFDSLQQVLRYYTQAKSQYPEHNLSTSRNSKSGHLDIEPLALSAKQLIQLEAFLNSLASPVAAQKHWLQAAK